MCRALAREGATVWAVGRNIETLSETLPNVERAVARMSPT